MVSRLPRALRRFAAASAAALVVAAHAQGLVNGGFDEAQGKLPAGWTLDAAVRRQGDVRLVEGYPGAHGKVLLLAPSGANRGDHLLGVGQIVDAAAYRGQRVLIGARLAGKGARGVIGVHAIGASGDLGHVQLASNSEAFEKHEATLDIPDAAKQLIVYAVVEGSSGQAVFDDLEIARAAQSAAPGTGGGSATRSARIDVDVHKIVRSVPPTLFGVNAEWIWDGQGLWSTAQNRLDPQAVAFARELGPTLIRFPGGVFSDSYHWREGLGPEASRPISEHTPGGEKSAHHFGIGEVSQLAGEVHTGLLLTVNAASGTASEAADWVRYTNGGSGPKVSWWEVGNELYMKGDASKGHLSATDYARRFLAYAAEMRKADPQIQLGAIGGLNYGAYQFISDSNWTQTVLDKAGAQVDFLAIHDAYAPIVIGAKDVGDPADVYRAMLAAPVLIERNLAQVSELLSRYDRPGHSIGIAVTEWGPLFHVSPDSPWVDHPKTMGSALFTASAMNAFLRTPRVQAANYFKLIDVAFMGLIGRRGNEWATTASYDVLSLYRRSVREQLVDARVQGPFYSSRAIGVIDAVANVPVVDAVASMDREGLTVIAVNKSGDSIATRVMLGGFRTTGKANIEGVSADAVDANTGTSLPAIPGLNWAKQVNVSRFDRGGPGEIRKDRGTLIVEKSGGGTAFDVTLPPYSVTAVSLLASLVK